MVWSPQRIEAEISAKKRSLLTGKKVQAIAKGPAWRDFAEVLQACVTHTQEEMLRGDATNAGAIGRLQGEARTLKKILEIAEDTKVLKKIEAEIKQLEQQLEFTRSLYPGAHKPADPSQAPPDFAAMTGQEPSESLEDILQRIRGQRPGG